jgi:hypothetical protein
VGAEDRHAGVHEHGRRTLALVAVGYNRIGKVLSISEPGASSDEFRQALKDIGFVQGQDVMFEFRLRRGNSTACPSCLIE